MELSDEQKQRILKEERQRLAEEQYRTQVRRELRSRTDSAAPVVKKSNTLRNVLIFVYAFIAILAVVMALIGFGRLRPEHRQSAVPSVVSSTTTETANRPSPLSPPPPRELTTAQIAIIDAERGYSAMKAFLEKRRRTC
jgi:cytoskeletal protein RodZ